MKRLIVLMHYFVIQTPDVSSGKCFQYWFRKYCYFTKGLLYVWFLCIGSGRNKNAISNKFLLSQKMSINGYHVPFIVIHAFFCTKTSFCKCRMLFASFQYWLFIAIFHVSFKQKYTQNFLLFHFCVLKLLSTILESQKVSMSDQQDVLNSFFVKQYSYAARAVS